jgi:hypothetical protein
MTDVTPQRQVPIWVFILVILLCLGGGVTFLYWYFTGARPGGGSVTPKSPEQLQAERQQQPDGGRDRNRGDGRGDGRRNRGDRPPGPPPSILQLTNNTPESRTYRVMAQGLFLEIVDPKTGTETYTFRPWGRRMLSEELSELSMLRRRVLRDSAFARYLNLQDWQRQRLEALDAGGSVIGDEDRAKVAAVWAELDPWNKPQNRELEQRLQATLSEIAQRNEAAIRERLTRQAETVKTILTPEQLTAARTMGQPGATSPPVPPAPPQ